VPNIHNSLSAFNSAAANMPLSHFAINTTPAKFDETVEFYKKALTPLGYTAILDYKFLFGFGTAPGQHDFWIYKKETLVLGEDCDIHFAFQADGTSASFASPVGFVGGTVTNANGRR
jgi:hypothetical protein